MKQNPSYIDILRGIDSLEGKQSNLSSPEPEYQPKSIRQFPHCQSMQFPIFPIPNQNPAASLDRTHARSMEYVDQRSPKYQAQAIVDRLSTSKDSKMNLGLKSKTLGSANHNLHSRNNEILFQVKLKLASFVTKFNIDSKCLASLREQSIETLIEMMFKKFKDYTKEHETLVKNYNENLKCKEIEILNMQTKLNNLQEILCQQNNKFMKAKQKLKEQISYVQKMLVEKNNQCEDLHQHVFMLQAIIRQQNQLNKDLENQKNMQFDEKIQSLQSDLSNFANKYNQLLKQSQQFNEYKLKLAQENQKLNKQINQIMEQNKIYKNEVMFAKQACEKMKCELEQNEEKLLLYYDRFMEQNSTCQRLREEIKEIQQVNYQLTQQIQKITHVVDDLQNTKRSIIEEKQLDRKQIQVWRKQCSLKQLQITKLKKTLMQVNSKSRILQKKSMPQTQTMGEYYPRNPQTSRSREKQKVMQIAHEQKIKKIIQEWRAQMEKTVDYYEKYIEGLQSQRKVR